MIYDQLYRSMFEIVSFFVRPQQDKQLVGRAGVALDTALFPLLMRVAHLGPLGIVELANQVDRDYTTVSRQVDKLVARGLLAPSDNTADKRVRLVELTDEGRAIVKTLADTRRKMMAEALKDWDEAQLATLRDNLDRLASTIREYAAEKD